MSGRPSCLPAVQLTWLKPILSEYVNKLATPPQDAKALKEWVEDRKREWETKFGGSAGDDLLIWRQAVADAFRNRKHQEKRKALLDLGRAAQASPSSGVTQTLLQLPSTPTTAFQLFKEEEKDAINASVSQARRDGNIPHTQHAAMLSSALKAKWDSGAKGEYEARAKDLEAKAQYNPDAVAKNQKDLSAVLRESLVGLVGYSSHQFGSIAMNVLYAYREVGTDKLKLGIIDIRAADDQPAFANYMSDFKNNISVPWKEYARACIPLDASIKPMILTDAQKSFQCLPSGCPIFPATSYNLDTMTPAQLRQLLGLFTQAQWDYVMYRAKTALPNIGPIPWEDVNFSSTLPAAVVVADPAVLPIQTLYDLFNLFSDLPAGFQLFEVPIAEVHDGHAETDSMLKDEAGKLSGTKDPLVNEETLVKEVEGPAPDGRNTGSDAKPDEPEVTGAEPDGPIDAPSPVSIDTVTRPMLANLAPQINRDNPSGGEEVGMTEVHKEAKKDKDGAKTSSKRHRGSDDSTEPTKAPKKPRGNKNGKGTTNTENDAPTARTQVNSAPRRSSRKSAVTDVKKTGPKVVSSTKLGKGWYMVTERLDSDDVVMDE